MGHADRWSTGALITRREVLGLQPDAVAAPSPANGVWLHTPVVVIEDQPEFLVTYFAPGARFEFPDGDWPTPNGRHPWYGRTQWTGHGCLMVHRPGDHFAVWHFWDGPDRDFSCWYLNLQTDLVRTSIGYDTQDLELDIIVRPDGTHEFKDAEVLDDRVAEGRYSPDLVSWIRHYGDQLVHRLEQEGIWWDRSWAEWTLEDLDVAVDPGHPAQSGVDSQ
jgi:hypothetical protein